MPKLARITVYPIKSLDGCDVTEAGVLPSGALANDRRWAIVDAQSCLINGKRTPAIHQIRSAYDDNFSTVTLSVAGHGESPTFDLAAESTAIAHWLSDALNLKCRLIENPDGGFPDDGDAPGPTLVSTASLASTTAWYEGVDLDEMRRRIRANLEIDAPEPFWEDQLADDGLAPRLFKVGEIEYRGHTICQRCPVPTRDSHTGEAIPGFARTFADRRQQSLPDWSPRAAFDHFYRVAINMSPNWIPDGARLHVGDTIKF